MCQDPVHDMCITQRKNALVIRHLWNAKLVLKSRGISDRLYTLFLNSGKKTKCFDCHFIYFFFFFTQDFCNGRILQHFLPLGQISPLSI